MEYISNNPNGFQKNPGKMICYCCCCCCLYFMLLSMYLHFSTILQMCIILLKGEWLIKSPLCLAAPWEWLDIGASSNFEFWSRIWKNTESPLTMALISIWSWRRNKKLGPGMDSMPKPHLPIHIPCSITILQLRLIALCPSWMKNSDKCTAHWCFVFSDEKVTIFFQKL